MEEEVKAVRGEGLGLHWPDPKHTRERLQKYLEQLQREWSKWHLEQEKEGQDVVVLDKDEWRRMARRWKLLAEQHKGPGKRIVLEYRCAGAGGVHQGSDASAATLSRDRTK